MGISIASGSGLFLLGNYGVSGDFKSNAEEWGFIGIMIAGGGSLLITALWQVKHFYLKHPVPASRFLLFRLLHRDS